MLNHIDNDFEKIENGVWLMLRQSSFLIASSESRKFKQAIIDCGIGGISSDTLDQIIAKTILLDWRDVKTPDGNDLPYSYDIALIAIKSNEELKAFVDKQSTSLANYVRL